MEIEALVSEAWRSRTTTQRLRELACEDPRLARIVASRIGLPTELAEELAARAGGADGGDGDVRTLRALAAQPATRPQRLALLARHPDEQVRRAVALHRSTPKAALKELATDHSLVVRRALAAREHLPGKLATALLTDASAQVRLTLARRFDARPKHLRALATDPEPRIRRLVAALGYADGDGLTDDDPRVRRTAVNRCGVEQLAPHLNRLVHDPDVGVRALSAHMRRNHNPTALAVLAADPQPAVRSEAAGNWYTPAEALTALAHDGDLAVLAQVSDNPFTPPQALAAIVEAVATDFDYDRYCDRGNADKSLMRDIIDHLLDHPAIPPQALRALHAKNLPDFHEGNAMSRPNWPPDLVIQFGLSYCASTVDEGEERRSYTEIDAARRTEPLDQVLATMLRSPIHYLRGAAAANRHTPPQALAEYVRTADPEMEEYHLDDAAKNPATPPEILEAWAAANERHYEMLKNPYLPESVLQIIAAGDNDFYAPRARQMLEVRAYRAGTQAPC
ncbi:hypothetical protein [Kitasatospora aureofaciens]|uniref:hypothetical protein n=1 Tax=Kitasatospora aureofaciens TaxID=1894 RepID=UPI003809F936